VEIPLLSKGNRRAGRGVYRSLTMIVKDNA
jgi:hypothetical protein